MEAEGTQLWLRNGPCCLTRDLVRNGHTHSIMLRPIVIARVEQVEFVVPLDQAGRLHAGVMSVRPQIAQVGSC